MKERWLAIVSGVLSGLLVISFGVFLLVVLRLQTAALAATAIAFTLVFALGVYAGARSGVASEELSPPRLIHHAGWDSHSRGGKAA